MRFSELIANAMRWSSRMAFLKRKYAESQAGWRHDLEVLVSLAEKHGETEIAEHGKACLRRLQT